MGGEILKVGPEDIDSAGDLSSKLGVHNQSKQLIKQIRENYPRELVAALSRPEDQGRTKMLDADEVEEVFGDTDLIEGIVEEDGIESARVFGQGKNCVVGIVFRTESGRSARAAIDYSEFPRSSRAYDDAIASGGVVLTDEDDPQQLRRALEAAQKQIEEGSGSVDEDEIKRRVEAEAAEQIDDAVTKRLQDLGILDEDGDPVEEEDPEPYDGYSDANVDDVVGKLPELSLSELLATKAAEEAREDPRKGVLEPLAERLEAAEAALQPAG